MAVIAAMMGLFLTGAAPGGAASKDGVTPQSTGCFQTFTNAGPPSLSVCVSSHGNINQITYSASGSPVTNIASEGYCLAAGPFTNYFDDSGVEGGWGAASASVSGNTITVTRTTTDGFFTLKQNIFVKYGSRMVLIGNLLKNNTTASQDVIFDRFFHGAVGGTSTNVYEEVGSSVLGKGGSGNGEGLMLTSLAPGLIFGIGAEDFGSFTAPDGGRSTCLHTFASNPTTPGNYVGIVSHFASIPAGATVNFKVGYRLM